MGKIEKFIKSLKNMDFGEITIICENNEVLIDIDQVLKYIQKEFIVKRVTNTYLEALSFINNNDEIVVLAGFC